MGYCRGPDCWPHGCRKPQRTRARCAALELDTAELTLSALPALAAEEASLDEAVSEEEMPSSSSSCSKKDETGDSPVASLLTALSLEAAALEGPSASPPGRAEDGTELACASDTGVLFRIPVRIKAAAWPPQNGGR